ncbi:MAG TPA: sigma-E factor regulatory protein RseB domain-containing protein [Oscillatoriaceae cyanobacterium]
MKHWLFALLGVLAIAPTASAHTLVTPDRIMRAQNNLTYTGLMVINGVQRVRIFHGPGMQLRQEYLNPAGQLADLLLSDGQTRWHYSPADKLVSVTPLEPPVSTDERLSLLKQNYDFQVLGEGRRANRPVVIARFVPHHAGNLVHLLWVDEATCLPLAVERRDGSGALVDRSEYTTIHFNPTFRDQDFRFNVPMGCHVVSTLTMLAHGNPQTPTPADPRFHPQPPRAVPPGYALVSWQLFMSNNHVRTFDWRYHDGLNPLSVFAVQADSQARVPSEAKTVQVDGHPAYLLDNEGEHLLMWTAQGTAYTAVGHLPEADLEHVADSTYR